MTNVTELVADIAHEEPRKKLRLINRALKEAKRRDVPALIEQLGSADENVAEVAKLVLERVADERGLAALEVFKTLGDNLRLIGAGEYPEKEARPTVRLDGMDIALLKAVAQIADVSDISSLLRFCLAYTAISFLTTGQAKREVYGG